MGKTGNRASFNSSLSSSETDLCKIRESVDKLNFAATSEDQLVELRSTVIREANIRSYDSFEDTDCSIPMIHLALSQ